MLVVACLVRVPLVDDFQFVQEYFEPFLLFDRVITVLAPEDFHEAFELHFWAVVVGHALDLQQFVSPLAGRGYSPRVG